MGVGGTNGRAYEAPPSLAPDSTETALIGLVSQAMRENTAATVAGFADMRTGLEAMAKQMRILFWMLGVGFLLMVSGLVSVVGGAVYLKGAGIHVGTGSAPVDIVAGE